MKRTAFHSVALLGAAVLPLEISQAQGCAAPQNYCIPSPNSVGSGAVISWRGAPSHDTNDFHLAATGCPPNQPLLFFYGAGQTAVPFGNGWQCVSSGAVGLFRFDAVSTDGLGAAIMRVDLSGPPAGLGSGPGAWTLGDTWYCQGWYRDPAAGGTFFNLTDALEVRVCTTYPGMALIPGGTFQMGDHSGTGLSNERPTHSVTLDSFYLKTHQVTYSEYVEFLNIALAQGTISIGANGVIYQNGGASVPICNTHQTAFGSRIHWNGSTFSVQPPSEGVEPAIEVSWFGACAYANHVSRRIGLPACYDEASWSCDFGATGYRLPTESEWEYAARGGIQSPYAHYPWGNTIDGSTANFANSGDPYENGPLPQTTPVGYYDGNQVPQGIDMANGYGLYDMAGNVWEWCWDWSDFYSSDSKTNPTGPPTGTSRVQRGGTFGGSPFTLRCAFRFSGPPIHRSTSTGFRLAANSN